MFTYLGILVTSFTVSSQSPIFIFIFITLGILQVCNLQVFCCFRWGSERINNMKVCEMWRYLQRVKFTKSYLCTLAVNILFYMHMYKQHYWGWGGGTVPTTTYSKTLSFVFPFLIIKCSIITFKNTQLKYNWQLLYCTI